MVSCQNPIGKFQDDRPQVVVDVSIYSTMNPHDITQPKAQQVDVMNAILRQPIGRKIVWPPLSTGASCLTISAVMGRKSESTRTNNGTNTTYRSIIDQFLDVQTIVIVAAMVCNHALDALVIHGSNCLPCLMQIVGNRFLNEDRLSRCCSFGNQVHM